MASIATFIRAIYKPLTVIMLFALIIIVIRQTGKEDGEEDTTFKTGEKAGHAVSVKVDTCFTGSLVKRVTATGLVKAARQADITPTLSGLVVEMPVQEGSCVNKGDVILKLDDREARFDWLSAKDQLSKAEDKFVEQLMSGGITANKETTGDPDYVIRMNTLAEQAETAAENGNGHEEEAAAARLWKESANNFATEKREARWASRSGLTTAKLNEQKARYRLDQCTIRAPFSGILGNQDVCIGRKAMPGTPVFTLVDLSNVTIAAQCLESEIAHIRTGSMADVSMAAFPGEKFKGRIVSINPIVDEKTRTCRVTVEVANTDGRIKAGMYAEVRLESARYENRMLIPRAAVLERDNRFLVFIARDGLAKWCYVDIGLSNDKYYEVTGSAFDLKVGEAVLIDGHYTLAHDSPIKIKSSK